MYVPTGQRRPSPLATELGGRIANLVHEYLAGNPQATAFDVLQAFEVARSLLPPQLGGALRRQRLLLAISVGMLVLGVLVALYLGSLG